MSALPQALLDAVSLAQSLYVSEIGAPAAQANREYAAKRKELKQNGEEKISSTSPHSTASSHRPQEAKVDNHQLATDGNTGERRLRERLSTAQALAKFEAEMLRRSSVMVKKSAENARILHDPVALCPTSGGKTRAAVAREELGKQSARSLLLDGSHEKSKR
jgi:hypothetical protein